MNVLLVPVCPPPSSTEMVLSVPDCVTVMLSVRTPEANAPDVVGLIVPAFVLRLTVPLNPTTVALAESCAVIVMLKAVQAVLGLAIDAIAKW